MIAGVTNNYRPLDEIVGSESSLKRWRLVKSRYRRGGKSTSTEESRGEKTKQMGTKNRRNARQMQDMSGGN